MKRYLLLAGAVLGLGIGGQYASTQTPPPAAAAQPELAGAAADKGGIDPAALSALERMTLHLGTLKNFEVQTTSSLDEVLENGQKLQFDGGATYRVKRPNAFFIEIRTDRRVRQFFYNGKTFTMYSPRMGVFAQVAAPGTIREVLQKAEDEYDISLPLNDLFRWGDSPSDIKALTSAMHVGYARIRDKDCDQYAFRQAEVDWQIWIERGANPLPRKLVITTRDDPAQPQYTAYLDWNVAPKFDAAAFDFKASKDTYEIEIVRVSDTPN